MNIYFVNLSCAGIISVHIHLHWSICSCGRVRTHAMGCVSLRGFREYRPLPSWNLDMTCILLVSQLNGTGWCCWLQIVHRETQGRFMWKQNFICSSKNLELYVTWQWLQRKLELSKPHAQIKHMWFILWQLLGCKFWWLHHYCFT